MTDEERQQYNNLLARRADVYTTARHPPHPYYGDDDIDLLRSIIASRDTEIAGLRDALLKIASLNFTEGEAVNIAALAIDWPVPGDSTATKLAAPQTPSEAKYPILNPSPPGRWASQWAGTTTVPQDAPSGSAHKREIFGLGPGGYEHCTVILDDLMQDDIMIVRRDNREERVCVTAYGTWMALSTSDIADRLLAYNKLKKSHATALTEAEQAARRETWPGVGEIVMMSEQRNKPGLPPRWSALARYRRRSAIADTEKEAREAALAIPVDPSLADKGAQPCPDSVP